MQDQLFTNHGTPKIVPRKGRGRTAQYDPVCKYPNVSGASGYRYGCRCERCSKGHSKSNHDGVCKEPGCDSPRMFRHQYCEQHARSINYAQRNGNLSPTITQVCSCCSTEFYAQKRQGSPLYQVWASLCQRCREATPLTRQQLVGQKVPPDLALTWLRQRDELACDICKRRLHRRSRLGQPVIDHAHDHCNTCN